MVTLGALVQAYGGWEWPEAVNGAKRTSAKCSLLGGRWKGEGPFSGLTLYRLLSYEDSETFEKAWSELKKKHSASNVADGDVATHELESAKSHKHESGTAASGLAKEKGNSSGKRASTPPGKKSGASTSTECVGDSAVDSFEVVLSIC